MAFEIKGFASIFGNIDNEGDIVLPGAFTRSLAEIGPGMKIPIFWEHEGVRKSGLPIGHTTFLEENSRGLFYRGIIVPTSKGLDVHMLIEAGSVDESSFAFGIIDQEISGGIRNLKELKITEISVVTWGANSEASVEVAQLASEHPGRDCNPEIEMCLNALDMVSALTKMQREIQCL